MSTYVYFVCLDHDPPLQSSTEIGQHNEVEEMRKLLDDREHWLSSDLEPFDISHPSTRSGVWFMRKHPTCRLACKDEYGRWTDLGMGLPDYVEESNTAAPPAPAQTFPVCAECGHPILPWQSSHIAKDRPDFHWMDDGLTRHSDCRAKQGVYADQGAVAALRWAAQMGTMPGMSWPDTLRYHAVNKFHGEVEEQEWPSKDSTPSEQQALEPTPTPVDTTSSPPDSSARD